MIKDDFNIYYSLWNSKIYIYYDKDMNKIIKMIIELKLNLILSIKNIIYSYINIIINFV